MRSQPILLSALLPLLATALATLGCSNNTDPHGSPVLLSVHWVSGGVRTQVWANTGSDASPQAPPVPAAGQEVDFVFDRLLDGSRIEDTITQNGLQMPVPKAMPPVTVTWPDAATVMSTPPFAAQVFYNSEPFLGASNSTAYVFLRPVQVGFPSSDTVVFSLDKTGLTSAYGDQMIGPAQISVATAPLSASFRLPSGNDGSATVATNYKLPVVFSNRVAGGAAIEPFARIEAMGVPLPVVLAADASDPTIVYLSPASCLGGWPLAVPIDVTIAAGAPDAFGVAMVADAHTTFMAAGASTAAPDGGCSSPIDAATD